MSVISNARIVSADIMFSRGFILDCWLMLEHEVGSQGFGGFVIGGRPNSGAVVANHAEQPNLAAEFISQVMTIADVEKFSELPGKVIRVSRSDSWATIDAIGHAFKEQWFNPDLRFAELMKAEA